MRFEVILFLLAANKSEWKNSIAVGFLKLRQDILENYEL